MSYNNNKSYVQGYFDERQREKQDILKCISLCYRQIEYKENLRNNEGVNVEKDIAKLIGKIKGCFNTLSQKGYNIPNLKHSSDKEFLDLIGNYLRRKGIRA